MQPAESFTPHGRPDILLAICPSRARQSVTCISPHAHQTGRWTKADGVCKSFTKDHDRLRQSSRLASAFGHHPGQTSLVPSPLAISRAHAVVNSFVNPPIMRCCPEQGQVLMGQLMGRSSRILEYEMRDLSNIYRDRVDIDQDHFAWLT